MIFGLTEVQGPIILLRCLSLIGFSVQLIKSLKFECVTTRETCRGVQDLRLLLQMLLLVRVGQMFAELATMNLDCKIHEDSFRRHPNATGGLLERSVACHMLFGAESTIVTFLYMSVTMLQLEVLKRIETIWTQRAMAAYARGVRHQPDGMIQAAIKATGGWAHSFEHTIEHALHLHHHGHHKPPATPAAKRWHRAYSFASKKAEEPANPVSLANHSSSIGVTIVPTAEEAAQPTSLDKHPSRMERAKKANDAARTKEISQSHAPSEAEGSAANSSDDIEAAEPASLDPADPHAFGGRPSSYTAAGKWGLE